MGDFVPDSLLGDIFVTVFSRRRDEVVAKSGTCVPDEEILLPSRGVALPNHTSKDLLSLLSEESARFFNFDCQASRASGGQNIPSQPITCDACGSSIRKQTHFIRCADCVDPFIDICVFCFSNGAEFGSHKRNHRYAVVKNKVNNRKILKVDLFEFFKFLITCEDKGSLNYAVFEKQVLGIKQVSEEVAVAPRAGRSSGRGVVRQTAENETTDDAIVKAAQIEFTSDAEKTYLGLLSLLTRCSEEDLVSLPAPSSTEVGGGPANYNVLRDEFEYEFLPEAETVLAAITPSDTLGTLFETYNGIQDERERRKKFLVGANLLSVKEYTNGGKKRKTDEKEMFEKVRIFARPVLHGLGEGDKVVKFLDTFAVALTNRKRVLERMKRLLLLHKNGVCFEDSSVMQFDTDRKKRHDINQRRIGGTSSKIWTSLPTIVTNDGPVSLAGSMPTSPTIRSTRTSGTPLTLSDLNGSLASPSLSALDAFSLLPGSWAITDEHAIAVCLEYFIAPQHWKVIELGVHALLDRNSDATPEDLCKIVSTGILGTTRRFILGAQGLPISGGPGAHQFAFSNADEIKMKIVQTCIRNRR